MKGSRKKFDTGKISVLNGLSGENNFKKKDREIPIGQTKTPVLGFRQDLCQSTLNLLDYMPMEINEGSAENTKE